VVDLTAEEEKEYHSCCVIKYQRDEQIITNQSSKADSKKTLSLIIEFCGELHFAAFLQKLRLYFKVELIFITWLFLVHYFGIYNLN